MAPKIELYSAFALPGERWINPESLHLLDDLSAEELQLYVDAGCIRIVEDEVEEIPDLVYLPESFPAPTEEPE